MTPKHTSLRVRRPPMPPILEIDEDGLPISEMSVTEGRRWSGEDDETSLKLADWPEFDD